MGTLRVVLLLNIVCVSMALTGCLDELTGSESGSNVAGSPNPNALFDPSRTVCDPFNTNSQQARDRGLIGNLVYLTNDQPRYDNVEDYVNHAVVAPVTIYLDRLYTPPRPFDLGFYTQSGELIKTVNNDTLYQYFGIQVKSQLQLAVNEEPGYYQLALLADVGGKIKITDANGVEHTIVNSEGMSATKFACAAEPVYLDRNSKLPMTVQYYQEASSHISLVAMWRPWPTDGKDPTKDVFCKRSVHSLFEYSDTAPAVPKDAYYEMLANNWKVLENENYYFPTQESNPCVPVEEPLAIAGFSISAIARDRVTLTWVTNIAATSQGKSKNVSTGVATLTTADADLVQSHRVTITGLLPNTLYSVQALSSSTGGQNAISDERAFRTPR